MAIILSGADVAKSITGRTQIRADKLRESGYVPQLAILRTGEAEDQVSYEKFAVKRCESSGISTRSIVPAHNASQEDILFLVKALNNDDYVHGVLILRPLPEHIDDAAICRTLSPKKDIDGITPASLAGVFTGSGIAQGAGFAPCTAIACMEILDYYNIDCKRKHAVVIGRSLVVGRPAAMMLMERNATVTICHSKTANLHNYTRDADIIIAATGQPESLGADMFSPGQTVIDVGTSWSEKKGKLCGDVIFDEVQQIAAAITPVPGGVGAVTTAVLAENVVRAAEERISNDNNRGKA